MNSWIDISVPIDNRILTWPTDPVFTLKKFAAFENGKPCDASEVSLSVHTGTHIDAPAHFINGGDRVAKWSPEITMGPCRVVEIKNKKAITAEEISGFNIQKGERILFKTANSDSEWWTKEFNPEFVHVAPDAAKLLASIKPLSIGIDYLSVGSPVTGVETHQHLLGAGIWLVETLDLTKIKPGNYEFIFLPVKFMDAEGAPGRALIR